MKCVACGSSNVSTSHNGKVVTCHDCGHETGAKVRWFVVLAAVLLLLVPGQGVKAEAMDTLFRGTLHYTCNESTLPMQNASVAAQSSAGTVYTSTNYEGEFNISLRDGDSYTVTVIYYAESVISTTVIGGTAQRLDADVPFCPPPPLITGQVWVGCPNEWLEVPNATIAVSPGGYTAITGGDGRWAIDARYDASTIYTVTISHRDQSFTIAESSPPSWVHNVAVDGVCIDVNEPEAPSHKVYLPVVVK